MEGENSKPQDLREKLDALSRQRKKQGLAKEENNPPIYTIDSDDESFVDPPSTLQLQKPPVNPAEQQMKKQPLDPDKFFFSTIVKKGTLIFRNARVMGLFLGIQQFHAMVNAVHLPGFIKQLYDFNVEEGYKSDTYKRYEKYFAVTLLIKQGVQYSVLFLHRPSPTDNIDSVLYIDPFGSTDLPPLYAHVLKRIGIVRYFSTPLWQLKDQWNSNLISILNAISLFEFVNTPDAITDFWLMQPDVQPKMFAPPDDKYSKAISGVREAIASGIEKHAVEFKKKRSALDVLRVSEDDYNTATRLYKEYLVNVDVYAFDIEP